VNPEQDGLACLAALIVIAAEKDPEEQKRMADRFKQGLPLIGEDLSEE
jgi:hypothetical protein